MFSFGHERSLKDLMGKEAGLLASDFLFVIEKRTGIYVAVGTLFSEPRYKLNLGSLLFFWTSDAASKCQPSFSKKPEEEDKNNGWPQNYQPCQQYGKRILCEGE